MSIPDKYYDHQLEIVVFPDHEMTSTNYHAVRTVPKSNRKIVERGKIDTLSTQIHDR